VAASLTIGLKAEVATDKTIPKKSALALMIFDLFMILKFKNIPAFDRAAGCSLFRFHLEAVESGRNTSFAGPDL
jgi:hypothetical protein